MENKSPMVVVTGGPCAGKTTILNFLRCKMQDYGWRVYLVSEAATFLIEQGMSVKQAVQTGETKKSREYQREIIGWIIENETRMVRCANIEGDARALILCDRGIPDNRAYLPEGS